MNFALDRIEVSGIVEIRDRLLKFDDALRLESGEPSFDTPMHIKEAIKEALDRNATHYVNSQGILPLREALKTKLTVENKIHTDSSEILVTNGGMHALYTLFRSLVECGDEVLIPDPNWTCVQWLIEMTGAKAVHVPLRPEKGFRFDFKELESKINSKTKAILINTPHNPTGAVFEEEDYYELLSVLKRHKVFLISDEAYEHILYDGIHRSIMSLIEPSSEMAERVISVFTMSKSYAMTGLRLGYIHCKNNALMTNMKKVVLYTANGVNSITQFGGIAAVNGLQDDRLHMVKTFESNRDILFNAINQSRLLSCSFKPKGAFYIFAKINPNWEGYESRTDDKAFVNFIIDKGRCGATPGSIFGPSGNGYVRFSYACATEMVEKAASFLQQL